MGSRFPDGVAIAVALDRSIGLEWTRNEVVVETRDSDKLGATMVCPENSSVRKPVEICWKIEASRWKHMLFTTLSK